jgi:Ca2+-binding RTX toxin-like protein
LGGASSVIRSSVAYDLSSSLNGGLGNAYGVNNLVYTGTSGATLKGNSNSNLITGGTGADTLYAGNGGDTLRGGEGLNNLYIINDSNAVVIGNTNGNDVLKTTVSYNLNRTAYIGGAVYIGTSGASLTARDTGSKLNGGVGSDTLLGSFGSDTLQAFGKSGGTIQSSNFEREVMTGGAGSDTFVLGDSKGSFYLDSGAYLPGVTSSKSDASWCGITDFEFGVDKIVLSQKASNQYRYTVEFYGDIKNDIIPQELNAISSSIGMTPRDNDVLIFQGNYDYQNGGFDFMAAVRATNGITPTADQLRAAVQYV